MGLQAEDRSHTGLGRRLAAALIDGGIVGVVLLLVVQRLLSLLTRRLFGVEWYRSGLLLEAYTFSTISFPVWLYFAFGESSSWQGTVGKRLLGLRVTGPSGRRIGFGRALLRTVIKMLPWELAHLTINLPHNPWIDPQTGELNPGAGEFGAFRVGSIVLVYVLVAIYIAVALLTRRKQSVHDLVVGTFVLRRTEQRERAR